MKTHMYSMFYCYLFIVIDIKMCYKDTLKCLQSSYVLKHLFGDLLIHKSSTHTHPFEVPCVFALSGHSDNQDNFASPSVSRLSGGNCTMKRNSYTLMLKVNFVILTSYFMTYFSRYRQNKHFLIFNQFWGCVCELCMFYCIVLLHRPLCW